MKDDRASVLLGTVSLQKHLLQRCLEFLDRELKRFDEGKVSLPANDETVRLRDDIRRTLSGTGW